MNKSFLVKTQKIICSIFFYWVIVSPKSQVVSIMFRQTILSCMAAIVAIACIGVTRVAAEQPGCGGAGMVEFVQITSMRLDAGEQTFEAFRILRSGMVEWARWNSSGHLLDHAEPRDMGSETFDRVVSSPSFSGSGIDAVSMNKMPDDIAELTNKIRRGVKAISVQPGWYIWTKPYPQIGKADIDISESRCDSAIAMVLSEAIATGRLIVRADDSIQAFVSGERANRIAFEAKLPIGNLLFGVLSAK